MTLIDIFNQHIQNNPSEKRALEIIHDSYISSVNDNYKLVIDDKGNILVRIPSLEKKDTFVFNEITEYDYPLVMCMNIQDSCSPDFYSYIESKFLEVYKDQLKVFFRDVATVDKLKNNIVSTKKKLEHITYAAIAGVIFCGLFICIFNISNTTKHVFSLAIILLFCCALYIQFNKDNKIKQLIDGYIATINTQWYNSTLKKHYAFLCNFIG